MNFPKTLLLITSASAALQAAETQKINTSYYKAPHSYSSTRDPDLPKYARHTQETGLGIRRDVSWLDVGLDYRLRAEYRHDDIRRATDGNQTIDAWGGTAEIGYRFDQPWKPRLSAFYGYASGDEDPNDNTDNRFERFYGFGRPWSANDYIFDENIDPPQASS